MTTYYCKCGRVLQKSVDADNTGNRDVDGCEGCPYLMDYGPYRYIEGKGFQRDVQGQECRMSPVIDYHTTYMGNANDKCTLRIVSLDLDFLGEVQAWIDENIHDGDLSGGFSPGSIRPTDYSHNGRFSWSISCAQNRKGMKAKSELIERFFDGQRHRKDIDPATEERMILDKIAAGKAAAHKKEDATLEAKQYKTEFDTVYAVRQLPSGEYRIMCRFGQGEWTKATDPKLSAPCGCAESLQEVLDAEAQRKGWAEYSDAASAPSASSEPPESVDNGSGEEDGCPYLEPVENSKKYSCRCSICGERFVNREICNKSYLSCGWYLDRQEREPQPEDDDEDTPSTAGCLCRTCKHDSCIAHGCAKECPANAEESCLTATCPEYSATEKEDEPCTTKTPAPTVAAAATTAGSAAPMQSTSAETTTTSASGADASTSTSQESGISGLSSLPGPGCPAETGDAESVARPAASPATTPSGLPAFDYSGLDAATVNDLHLAEREVASGKKMAEIGLRRMADGVAIAHEALCGACDIMSQAHNNQHSENTFGAWCESVGLNRKAAERLLNVARLFDASSPKEQQVLETLGPTLLYAAAKPSAPAELVQGVKDGDITSHKQYKELLAQLNAEKARADGMVEEINSRDAKINNLIAYSEEADRRTEKEGQKRKDLQRELEEERASSAGASALLADEQQRRQKADEARIAAEKRASEAEKSLEGARHVIDASKRRDEKARSEIEDLRSQLADLKSKPIEAPVVDAEELDRMAAEKADAIVEKRLAELAPGEDALHNAQDAVILAVRIIDSISQLLMPHMGVLDNDQIMEACETISRATSELNGGLVKCLKN